MDIIKKIAHRSYESNIAFTNISERDSINNIKLQLYDFENQLDKIKFIDTHIDLVNEEYQKHLKTCKNPENCGENEKAETLMFYLQQELINLGVQIDNDTFTYDEKASKDSQLEEILKQLNELKAGQQVIYDDVLKEIQELKELYFLGKKKWHQLLAGKIIEMTAGGIISETISKDLLSTIKPTISNLLN
jgi:hypothetical protein